MVASGEIEGWRDYMMFLLQIEEGLAGVVASGEIGGWRDYMMFSLQVEEGLAGVVVVAPGEIRAG